MILILLGTQDKPFNRLGQYAEQLVKDSIVQDEILLQSGCSPFDSNVLKVLPFVDHNEMNQLIDKANLVISHAGVGSIVSALKKGKKIIVVPRRAHFGEHVNDHQQEIASHFQKNGYILKCDTYDELVRQIQSLHQFNPKEFVQGNHRMISLINDFIL